MSYSNKTHVILIKGEVRTTEVSLVKEDHECTGTCLVYYKRAQEKGKGRLYQYSLQEDKDDKEKDVIVLTKPTVYNPRIYEVYYKGKPQENVYILCHFKAEKFNYWTIGFTDGNMDIVCPDSDIKIHRKTSIIEPSKDIQEYLTQMAYLHGYDLRSSDGSVLLGDQYDHLRRGDSAPLLEAYLNPQNSQNFQINIPSISSAPLYPYCTNASQMEAAKKALSNRISVIQGPPGTGKTETILNILLNLVLCGKSVLIVAGSNSAIDNIAEKLQEEKLDFLIARLGREKNKESFIKQQKAEDLCPSEWDDQSLNIDASLSEIRQLSTELESLFIADRDLYEAIEQGKQATVLKLRRKLEFSSYNEKRERLKSLSMKVLKKLLYKRFGGDYTRQSYTLEDLGEQSSCYESFIQDYPIVLSTAFSATKCIAQNSLFGYVIMDEASQIDVATGALALSVAKNAVIVGDVKQLPNVIKKDMKVVSQAIYKFFRIPQKYNYADHNFLQSVCEVFENAPETLLREHYRCHPKIVRFFNNEFYNGQLVAMTEDHGEKDVLVLRKTVPGYHAADFTNHREEEIEYLKRDLGIDGKDAGVGIITPYNNQVDRIKDDEDIEEVIMGSTVHQFQGRQKDIIIISTVDNEYTRFVNDPNLFNVAVSRAKKQLILVTNGNNRNKGTVQHLVNYIKASSGRCEKGKVKSLFDLIYPQYKSEYKKFTNALPHIDPSEYAGQEAPSPTEIIAYGFITDVLKEFPDLTVKFRYPLRILISDTSRLEEDEEEIKFAQNKNSHIDFMIFMKDAMEPFLAIEIDGSSYHIEDSFQAQLDSLKDGILAKYGIPIKRFRTKESVEEKKNLFKEIKKFY